MCSFVQHRKSLHVYLAVCVDCVGGHDDGDLFRDSVGFCHFVLCLQRYVGYLESQLRCTVFAMREIFPVAMLKPNLLLCLLCPKAQVLPELRPRGAATVSKASCSGSMPRPALFSATRYL